MLWALVENLDKTGTWYKLEIRARKTKLMTNGTDGIQKEIKVKEEEPGRVTSSRTSRQLFQIKAEHFDCLDDSLFISILFHNSEF